MKKVFLFSIALAGLMLGSCSSSDELNGGAIGKNEGKTSYIAIDLNNVGSAPNSRAGDCAQGGGTYEDGNAAESKVEKVRFYFFDNTGDAYPLKDQSYNYIEETPSMSGGPDHDKTIEQISQSVLIINGEKDEDPAKVVAVINPQTLGNELGTGTLSLSQLREKIASSYVATNNTAFVMSNSVYEDNAKNEFCATDLMGHIATSAEAAEKSPVEVYVERVAAKVTTGVSATDSNWESFKDGDVEKYRYPVGEFTDNAGKSYQVYAQVEGWGLADESSKAPICKAELNDVWTDTELGIAPWTTADYHRCFWELNEANTSENPIKNYAFQDYTTALGSTPIYTLPNTPDVKLATEDALYNNYLTKVLVAAKLVYKDGDIYKAAEICTYKGVRYLGENSVLTVIANEFKTQLFTKTTQDGNDVYTGITPEDLDFDSQAAGIKEYQVVAKLKAGTYYVKKGSTYEVATEEDKRVVSLEPADVRKEGMAYYYTTIQHLGSKGSLGEYGVVRNHVYKITIGKIAGFGTPVYNPNKEIQPQLPSDTNAYLAAQINILSWRVVPSMVDLDKTTGK